MSARIAAPKPNLFLVGAPKAGTTSIDQLLREHPDVFLSPIKEPCHFCTDVADQLSQSVQRKRKFDVAAYLDASERKLEGLAWVDSPGHYARLFDAADAQPVIGECSTFYLSSKVAARAIHDYNPDARIVALLRDPLQRIRSHYEMDRVHGLTARSLTSLIEEELALGDDAHWGNCFYYLGASRYAPQLARFRQYFPHDKVLVLSFESLLADTEATLRQLYAFLGIDALPELLALPSANRGRAARFPGFNRALHASGLKPLVSGLLKSGLSSRLEQRMKSAYYRRGVHVVSDEEMQRIGRLLRDEGLMAAA
ncbi:sulfotransferase family protein [Cognatiluteimonas profundi]|uniref:sulfotransferase family protein n=1 Tax=Cognatiluteimonas profundi TaxID=2594501 RepID=UPI00131B8575|nr:sulfotransferase [Lysobacter profundi]